METRKEQTSRIRSMESRFRRVRKAVDALNKALDKYDALLPAIEELDDYQRSGQWLHDFEADERGEIDPTLPRGVLSEDGLYDLLSDLDALRRRLAADARSSRA